MQIYSSCSGVCLVTRVTENETSKLSHTVSVSVILEISRKLWENHNLSQFYRSSYCIAFATLMLSFIFQEDYISYDLTYCAVACVSLKDVQ